MNTENISESNIESLLEIAVQKHQSGEWDEAESLYKQILTLLQSELANQYHPIALGNLANIFEKQGKLDAAVEYYQQALKLKPDSAEVNYNLGNVLYQQGKLDAAVECYQQALKIKPEIAQAHNNLGNVFLQQGKLDAAIESYQQALKLKPDYAQAHHNLGNVFLQQGKLDAAVESYQQALNIQPNYAAYHNLGNALKLQGKLEAAIKSYQQSISLNPNYVEVHQNLGNTLYEQGKLEAAIESYQQALRLNPDFAPAKFGIVIGQLPIIYSSFEEINIKRNNYQQRLEDLAQSYKLTNPKALEKAVDAVGSLQPFYLAYQGGNDRDLQQIYGETIVQILSSRYPQYSQPIALPDLKENEKIRVGFVSGFFSNHSNWLIPIKGWVENLDKNKFELYGYYTGLKQDRETAKAAQAFGKFVQGNLSVEQWCEAIAQDKLHILIFPEFGMDPMTIKLGCLRLALIQITSWGHPNTSGLPTIDFYLSSDLMEPENAQEHYTEKLVRLPNLSIYYTPLAIQPQAIGKKEIGIAEDEIMFWCCQSLFKYLPQHDDVFPQIAKELGKCKFVFIKYDKGEYVTEVFQQRLNRAFQEYGLNYQEYCIFLPRMDAKTFAGVTAIADVFLDSIGWSGCNSTLEAIAHNIPVMTLPGDLMRARHTMAILKMMGVSETIASSKEDYIKIAVRLGQNPEYRQHISQQIAANQHKLYCDKESVRSLEAFLQNAVQKKSAGNLDAALDYEQKASTIKPDYAEAHYSLGNVLLQQGKFDAAAISYQKALTIKPDFFEVHNDLGNVLFQQSKLDAAAESYQKALAIKPDFAEAHNNLGNVFFQQEKLEAAVESYQKALEIQPNLVDTVYNLGQALAKQLKLEAAVECYRKALEIQPDYVAAKFGICMNQLPIIYASDSEVKSRRDNYQQELQKLAKSYQLGIPQELEKAADAVGTIQPFYLAYQGKNDRDLQQTYGETIVKIMANRYPQWSKPIALTELKANEKVRVGIVSGYFRLHSNWKIPIKGWVENLDRSEFELFGYYTNAKQDRETFKAAKVFDKFIQGPLLLEQWCELIQQDKLHILIFPEFGMNPMTVKLGCLRLAPIQMTSWGHPDTSGLPTIDYYLSSDLMEPENAQEHYTEKLVRLPNLSIHYTPLAVEAPAIGKQAIGIAEDEIMFWCCQSLFKYLPQDDDVFPLIAKELGKCKFVFIEAIQSKYINEVFRQRLSRAFEAFGLNYQDHCIFLPRLDSNMFAAATAMADVFLDSLGWSGCNSTLEAIAYNIPVMTLPGELMRGRHTMAILKMMGISETIAATKEDYVKIAVRLGQDAQYRQHISQQIAQKKHQLYGDLKPVRALEDFLLKLVNKPRRFGATEVAQTLQLAVQHQRENRLALAEQLYRQVLEKQPDHPEALYGLGMLMQQMGQPETAQQLLVAASQVQPDSVKIWFSLGNLRQ
ncbi:tetratricopeptide repeat protein, partial [Microseira wollei]|uniref:tetratricopeptide repeat protein n=1 Tax=Microseira wollei TaxID=467598 RepID=UPI001CFDBEA6